MTRCSLKPIRFLQKSLWRLWGIEPDYVVGIGQGEYAAAVVSGILTLEQALLIVGGQHENMDQTAIIKAGVMVIPFVSVGLICVLRTIVVPYLIYDVYYVLYTCMFFCI